jgi:hypothetical protein
MNVLQLAIIAVMTYATVVADMPVAPSNAPTTEVKVTPATPNKPADVKVVDKNVGQPQQAGKTTVEVYKTVPVQHPENPDVLHPGK